MVFRRKWVALAAVLVSLAVLLGSFGCGKQQPEPVKTQNLVVNVIDIGQGDAILIRSPEQVTLIDTGDVATRDRLVSFLKKQGITVVDNLIITHPHSDHLGGAAAVLEQFAVKHIYDSGQTTTSALYRNYLSLIQKKNIPFTVLAAGSRLDIGGGAVLSIFGPESPFITGSDSDLNNNSVVAKLTYGSFAMLLPGDAELEAEGRLLKRFGGELKSQVLKSGHHGSHTSSSLPFLKAVSPEVVIVSDGLNNEYHHPHPSTLRKYGDLGIKVYRTDSDGTVTVVSDGKTYTVTKERQ
ncbi:MAG: ComEC/Rec2 family competence protein [Negativicutes bacterium]|nr:ComEC/Rec2 family competence protein [Negativicutes bacterium]